MTIQGDEADTFYRIPGHPGFPEELYMGRTYVTTITRKDKMREGFVARTFHIPIDIDDRLRMEAVKKRSRIWQFWHSENIYKVASR